ncbi:MAG: glutamate--tRNA ligase [Proteobacteria bacterium]|nr:glutamate--tRNA ligase [Pseudomonadota bacterium]
MANKNNKIVTRFAPSPSGFLHIGGARTALFNWLFTRGRGGKFLLRIEDTDKKRSTKGAIEAIIGGLTWLGIDWDDEVYFQSRFDQRHREVAETLLRLGKAYKCYTTPEELDQMRRTARAAGRPMGYDGRWRDRDPAEAPKGVNPVIRLKTGQENVTTIKDAVQGAVTVSNDQLDDMVLLRSDGTPTYMLSVVVDDHDMAITHVIRGNDHLTNAFRQTQLYQALDWTPPTFAHIPLIHGPDGAKLSKRHGALGIEAYRELGYLPEALRNYLSKLGWGYQDHEVFSSRQAMEWFTLEGIGKGPARFDLKKLENLNGIYIRSAEDSHLASKCRPFLEKELRRPLSDKERMRFLKAMPGLKERAKTLIELARNASFYFADRPLTLTEKAEQLLDDDGQELLRRLIPALKEEPSWEEQALLDRVKRFAEKTGIKLGMVAGPLRAALTGSHISPSVFEVMAVLGKEQSLARIEEQAH